MVPYFFCDFASNSCIFWAKVRCKFARGFDTLHLAPDKLHSVEVVKVGERTRFGVRVERFLRRGRSARKVSLLIASGTSEWLRSDSDDPMRYLVDPASSHMLVSKIKPCMSKYKLLYGETADGSLKQLLFT